MTTVVTEQEDYEGDHYGAKVEVPFLHLALHGQRRQARRCGLSWVLVLRSALSRSRSSASLLLSFDALIR